MFFFVLSLAVLLQLHIESMTILAVDSVIGLVVIMSREPHHESLSVTYLPSASCEDMMQMKVVGASRDLAFLLALEDGFSHSPRLAFPRHRRDRT